MSAGLGPIALLACHRTLLSIPPRTVWPNAARSFLVLVLVSRERERLRAKVPSGLTTVVNNGGYR